MREQAAAAKERRERFGNQGPNSPDDSLPSPSGVIPRQTSSSGISESGMGPILDFSLNLDSPLSGSQSLTMTPTPTQPSDLNWPQKASIFNNGHSSDGDNEDVSFTLQQGIFVISFCNLL